MIKMEKTAIERLLNGDNFNSKRFELFRNNSNVAKVAVGKNGQNLKYLSRRLKDDKEIVLLALDTNPYALNSASPRLKSDLDVVWKAVQLDPTSITFSKLPGFPKVNSISQSRENVKSVERLVKCRELAIALEDDLSQKNITIPKKLKI